MWVVYFPVFEGRGDILTVLHDRAIIFISPQLVIKDEIFALPSVKTLIEKCRTLAGHANMSTKFYHEFYAQQEKQLGITNNQALKQDVVTR